MNLTIVGDGIGETVLDGTDSTNLINANPAGGADNGGTLTLRDLSIEDARTESVLENGGAVNADGLSLTRVSISGSDNAYNGGALYAEGNVTIVDSTFTDNDTSEGGAVLYAWNIARTVSISNSVFDGNRAGQVGGAVFARGDLNIYESSFSYNEAVQGGAVVNIEDDAVVFIENSEFVGNTAGTLGGALVMQNLDRLEVSGTLFSENRAEDAFGGAMNIFNTEEVIITSSKFVENEARGGYIGGNGNGGAIDACNIPSFTSTRSLYQGNVSTGNGGAIGFFGMTCFLPGSMDLVGNRFIGNEAWGDGGAIWFAGTLQRVVRNQFVDNVSGSYGGARHVGASLQTR
jgi:hypothetical protein